MLTRFLTHMLALFRRMPVIRPPYQRPVLNLPKRGFVRTTPRPVTITRRAILRKLALTSAAGPLSPADVAGLFVADAQRRHVVRAARLLSGLVRRGNIPEEMVSL
jgi:hypothetical protein